jgi:hypothetical protein
MPVLSSRRLVRLGGISAMVGGALSLVLALLLAPGPSLVRFRAETPLFDGALELAGVVGSLLIAVGALGLYAAVVRRSPRLATARGGPGLSRRSWPQVRCSTRCCSRCYPVVTRKTS